MVDAFDRSSKVTFKNSEDQVYIKFGSYRDHDPKLGISRGQLLLKGCIPMQLPGYYHD